MLSTLSKDRRQSLRRSKRSILQNWTEISLMWIKKGAELEIWWITTCLSLNIKKFYNVDFWCVNISFENHEYKGTEAKDQDIWTKKIRSKHSFILL